MSRLLRKLTIFLCVTLTSASVHAKQQRVEELRFPAGAIVGFHLTEPYLSCAVGTRFKVKISVPIDSKLNKFGDAVDGMLASPLICNNAPVLPAGTAITGSFVLIGGEAASQADSFGIELTFVNARPGKRSIHAKIDSKQLFAASHAATGRPAVNQRAENHRKAALAQLKSGNVEGAIAELRSAIKLDDNNPSYHFSLGDALFKKRDFSGALAELQQGYQRVPQMTSSQHQALAQFLLKRGDVDGGIQEFQRAAQLAPDDVQSHENLAAAFARKSDVNAEIDQYREIARSRPNDLGNHKRLAVALMSQKNFADAKNEFREVLRLAPNNAGAYAGLGAADTGLGNYGAASSELQQALQIDPQNAFAQRSLNALSQSQQQPQPQQQQTPPPAQVAPSANCNTWPPEFDQIRDPEKQDALRVDWAQKVQQSGQTFQQLISAMEQTRATLQSHLEDVKQSILGTASEPITSFDFDFDYEETCKNNPNIGANLAAECEYVNTQDAILGANGTIQILNCMAGMPSVPADNPAAPAAPLATYTPGGQDSSSPTGKQIYTPGSSSTDNSDTPGVYTPGSHPATNDTSMGMLDTGGNLKQAYVGMTSDYSAVTEQNQSSCDATIHVTLLSSQPSGSGASLQFQASVQPNPSSPSVPSGCFELEYTIEATQRMSNGDPGPAAGQTYHTKFSTPSDTVRIELPVASTGSNDIDLVGWHVSGALCNRAQNCAPKLSSEECAQLQDYRQNELPNERMNLIKQYGIISIRKDSTQKMRSDLAASTKDPVTGIDATGDLASFLIDLETATQLIEDIGKALAPEAGLLNPNLFKTVPVSTAEQVLGIIDTAHDSVDAVKQLQTGVTADTASDLALNAAAKLSPIVAIMKDIADNIKEHQDQNSLIQYINGRLNDLDNAIDDYNQTLQQIMSEQEDLKAISDGIDLACGGGASNEPNQ